MSNEIGIYLLDSIVEEEIVLWSQFNLNILQVVSSLILK